MSKNLRGLSGSNVTINLLDIDANSVTATTGTFTDIIATNYSINNVSISNLIVSGVVRLTGIENAPVTLLPEYEILFKDPYNNLVYKFSSLVFNTTAGTLKSPGIITALMTVGDIYVTGNLTLEGSMPALQVTGQADLGTGLSIQALASVASNSVHPLVVWNSTTKNISQDNTKLYYDTSTDTLYSPNISVTNFNIVPVTRSDNIEYPVVFFDDNTDNIATDSDSTAFRYNPSTNRLTLRECKVDGKVICDQLAITKEFVPGAESQVKLFIEDGFNFKIEDTTNIEGFYFLSGLTEWMRIAVGETRISTDVEISGNTTLENNLTVEGNITCENITTTGNTSIRALNNTTALASRIPFINGGESGILVSRGNFNYNTSTQTLNVGTINTIQDITIGDDLSVVGSTSLGDATVTGDFICNGTATFGDDMQVTCPITTETDNNRIAFIEAKEINGTTNYGQGILSRGSLYFNNSNQTLFCQNLLGQVLVYCPKLRVTPPSAEFAAGEFTVDGNNGLTAQHATSFCVKVNGNKQVQIETANTTFFNPLQCDDVLTLNSVPTVPSTSNTDILLLDSANNQISKSGLTFNANGGVLSTTNITLTGALSALTLNTTSNATIGGNLDVEGILTAATFNVGTQTITDLNVEGILTAATLNVGTQSITDFEVTGDLTAGDNVFFTNLGNTVSLKTYNLLVKDTSDDAVKKTTGITAGVNSTDGKTFIDVDQIKTETIILNGLPLNYTETYNTDTWGIQSNGSFGGGNYILLPSNGTLKQYGSLLNPSGGIFGLKSASSEWGFTNSAYDGLYEINISCYFQNNDNARVIPRLNLYRWRNSSYSQQLQLHADSSYVRFTAGKINSIGLRGKIHLTSVDRFKIPTLANNNTSTDFGDQVASFVGTDFVISMTYLGKLTETITT
jgi:hypothetical protein